MPSQAIQLLKENQFDLAIIDMQMPDTTGVIVAKEIKSYQELHYLPIIFLSSIKVEFMPDERDLFSSYLLKPARELKLWRSLLKALDIKDESSDAFDYLENIEKLDFSHLKVLVAEDNIINQKVTQSQLSNIGVKPDIVVNGLEAVKACKEHDYHIVLMDVQMPEMDGLEATRAILKYFEKSNEKPPVILAMTANVLGESKNQCISSGMLGFISKPVKVDELEKEFKKWGG